MKFFFFFFFRFLGMCQKGGCPGQWDTANFNSYLYANNNGLGPAFVNMCARTPSQTSFIPDDNKYHTYAIEWHTYVVCISLYIFLFPCYFV